MTQDSDSATGSGLPASVEAAWGLRGRPLRGPRPGLSLERIVQAGVQVAAAEGLSAVSMGRVATELGTGPMSLYRYVASKDELLALMADAVYGPPPAALTAGENWRDGLRRWAVQMRRQYQQHPWTLQIPISGLPIRPNDVAWFENGLAALIDTALPEESKSSVILLVSGYVRNNATIEADVEAAMRASGQPPDVWMSSYARNLTRLADPQRFPAIARFIASGVFERFDPPDAEFNFGLDRILDGIGLLVDGESTDRRSTGRGGADRGGTGDGS
jgi:AcrR family transcriptional regulator